MKQRPFFLGDLRIADLELFIDAALFSNLGKAAHLHHLSQSGASSAIKRVEKSLGLTLCLHERRAFQLTREGQLLLPIAKKWLQELRELLTRPKSLPMRLATTHALARAVIPAMLTLESIELLLMRPDQAYNAVLRREADLAVVIDNALWKNVMAVEVGKGSFQLYSRKKKTARKPLLLPEDQMEVLALQQKWKQLYQHPLSIKARLPSWSLIADICARTDEVGFLPDFLGKQSGLYPVAWQPPPSHFRILALYREVDESFLQRLETLITLWKPYFS